MTTNFDKMPVRKRLDEPSTQLLLNIAVRPHLRLKSHWPR